MPRYYFHLTTDENTLASDEIGEELPMAEAARDHAVQVARELACNQQPSYVAGKFVSAVDERGAVVFTIPLKAEHC